LVLMQQARAALAAHDPARALRALNEHARRFPDGALAEEREGLRIAALQAAGKRDEAQRDADRFKKRYPRSVLSQPSSGPTP
jgi:outer membrane protein assembly factor BamD (BamD/ComL family)